MVNKKLNNFVTFSAWYKLPGTKGQIIDKHLSINICQQVFVDKCL